MLPASSGRCPAAIQPHRNAGSSFDRFHAPAFADRKDRNAVGGYAGLTLKIDFGFGGGKGTKAKKTKKNKKGKARASASTEAQATP